MEEEEEEEGENEEEEEEEDEADYESHPVTESSRRGTHRYFRPTGSKRPCPLPSYSSPLVYLPCGRVLCCILSSQWGSGCSRHS